MTSNYEPASDNDFFSKINVGLNLQAEGKNDEAAKQIASAIIGKALDSDVDKIQCVLPQSEYVNFKALVPFVNHEIAELVEGESILKFDENGKKFHFEIAGGNITSRHRLDMRFDKDGFFIDDYEGYRHALRWEIVESDRKRREEARVSKVIKPIVQNDEDEIQIPSLVERDSSESDDGEGVEQVNYNCEWDEDQ